MLLIVVVTVLCSPVGRCWARTMGDENTPGSTVQEVRMEDRAVPVNAGNNTLNVNGTEDLGDFNGQIEQKSPLAVVTREVQKWLKEYIEDSDEGRHFKRKRMMLQMMMLLKVLVVGVALPLAITVALFAAWKGVTLSLLALMLAGVVGLKGLLTSASSHPQHVLVSGLPSHHDHYWRRRSEPPDADASTWSDVAAHRLVYRAYS